MKRSWERRADQSAHIDDWLMTYADMITLLLCFFVVILMITITKKDISKKSTVVHEEQIVTHQETPILKTATKYPEVFQGNLPFHDIDDEEESSQKETKPTNYDTSANQDGSIPKDKPTAEAALIDEGGHQKQAEPGLTPFSSIVSNLVTNGSANVEKNGNRISIIDIQSAAFFDVGSAIIREDGKAILKGVAEDLKSEKYAAYNITVEGHTDDTPIKTAQFPSNWELSTARASAVVHYFLDQGISAQKLRAAGYADTFPKASNRDSKGDPIPENQSQNRRVIIKLEKIENR